MSVILKSSCTKVLRKICAQFRTVWAALASSRRMRWEISVLLGTILAVVLTAQCSSFASTAARVRQDTLRLHVQAASDSPADQLLKLRVRDAVLQQAARIFMDCPDQAAAKKAAAAALPQIQLAVERAVAQQGASCPVRVYITRMSFPTTHYQHFSLPAGPYDALRVELGKARGHNWFCVLYPALCLPAAGLDSPTAWPTQQEQQLVSSGCTVRFAVLEWWQHLVGTKSAVSA